MKGARSWKILVLAAMTAGVLGSLGTCQTAESLAAGTSTEPSRSPWSPEPYKADEFPRELQDLRRAEVVTLGSLPLTFLVANLGYTGARSLFYMTGVDTTWDGETDTAENVGILSAAIAGSLLIAVADHFLLEDQRAREEKEKERIRLLRSDLPSPVPLEAGETPVPSEPGPAPSGADNG